MNPQVSLALLTAISMACEASEARYQGVSRRGSWTIEERRTHRAEKAHRKNQKKAEKLARKRNRKR